MVEKVTGDVLRRNDLKGRSLISMRSYTPDEITLLLDAADDLRALKRARDFRHHLKNRNIALVFLKPSARTRVAFVVAANDEGAHLEIFPAEDIRFGIKESVRDIARVLGRVFDGLAFRGYDETTIRTLADYGGIPVWNGLSDGYHPTQVLADLMTMRDVFGDLRELPVAYVGDARNNQARSLAIGAVKMGYDLRLVGPSELFLSRTEIDEIQADDNAIGGRVTMTEDLREGLSGCAVVYGDVWVSMGEDDQVERRIDLLRGYKVTAERMRLTERDDSIYLHCLPAFHDLDTSFAQRFPDVQEVDDDVFEGAQSRVFDQSENRMHTAEAVMVLTVG